jgi:peroxiredoxin
MAATTSSLFPLGAIAPKFSLPDVCNQGAPWTLGEVPYAATVIVFMCNHCPYVVHLIDHMASAFADLQRRGVSVVGICSNDAERYPDDSPARMQEFAVRHQWTGPYLHDATQDVARAYMAQCTPEFFVLDSNFNVVYRGRYDETRPGSTAEITGSDLLQAVNAVLAGAAVPDDQIPSIGCSIKWK